MGIQTKIQFWPLINPSQSDLCDTDFAPSHQKLGTFLENKVFQKLTKLKYFVNKSCSPISIFFSLEIKNLQFLRALRKIWVRGVKILNG